MILKMQTIYVPTFAAIRGDVETIFGLLEKEVLKKHRGQFDIGLEIGGLSEHFTNPEYLENIVENIKSVASGVKTTVHGFSGLEIYTKDLADMSKGVGKNLLKTYIKLAKKLGSNYVHVHGAVGYQGIKEPKDKEQVLMQIRKNLLFGLNSAENIKIGIENLPKPSGCDFETNPKKVWSDYVEEIQDCLQIVKGTDLKITFDTAHYSINKTKGADLISPAQILKNHLYHIHLGDSKGDWGANKSKAFDGLIPGDGKIGENSFAEFFKYIRKHHSNVGICVEVRNKDYKNPVETKESIRRLVKWLI